MPLLSSIGKDTALSSISAANDQIIKPLTDALTGAEDKAEALTDKGIAALAGVVSQIAGLVYRLDGATFTINGVSVTSPISITGVSVSSPSTVTFNFGPYKPE